MTKIKIYMYLINTYFIWLLPWQKLFEAIIKNNAKEYNVQQMCKLSTGLLRVELEL